METINDVEIFPKIIHDWKYRKIVGKIEKSKQDDIPISHERIREMQKYFGFEKLKQLNNFLNKLPENAVYQEYTSFQKSENIEIDFPEYIDKKKLISEVRREYAINTYKEGDYFYISFTLIAQPVTRPETFKILEKIGVFERGNFVECGIIDKILNVKKYNFLKIDTLPDIKITDKRIEEMQKYFGFTKLKELDDFLNKLPINSLYIEYAIFPDNDKSIDIAYNIDMNTHIFPEYINRSELIFSLRRNFSVGKYAPVDNKNRFEFESISFNLHVSLKNDLIFQN